MKPVALMQPGPIHLFFGTGVFYFFELAEQFDFVFLASDDYLEHAQFQQLAGLPEVRHVEYVSENGILARHFHFAKKVRSLLIEHQPRIILQHNRSYLANQYLLELSKEILPNAQRYYFQNCRTPMLWEDNFAALRDAKIESLSSRNRLLSRNLKLAGTLVDFKAAISFILNYKVYPLFAVGKVFRPPVNVLTGLVDRVAAACGSRSGKDFLLAYMDEEIEGYRGQGFENILKVRHPVKNVGQKVFKILYGDVTEQQRIMLLPSYGFTSRLIVQGWSEAQVADHIGGKWCEAVDALLVRFPAFGLAIKLHPASKRDPTWVRIIENITQKHPQLVVVSPGESAELCVVRSRVIVSDVSTVMWWAALWGGKTVISLDIFGYPGGHEMGLYFKHIQYIDDVSKISAILPEPAENRSVDGTNFSGHLAAQAAV